MALQPDVSSAGSLDREEADRTLETIRTLLSGHTDRQEEARILEILKAASPPLLNDLLRRVDLPHLLESFDDRAVGPDLRTALVNLLGRDRLEDLTLETRAHLINALQAGHTEAVEEQLAASILLGTKGRDLTGLKNLIDAGDDHRDLQQLLFVDLDSSSLRTSILEHFVREAASHPGGELKVLSDIDDTFYCNWVDARYPKKAVYPGVLQLYRELDRGAGEIEGRAGDLAFLTARPGDRVGVVERETLKHLREMGVPACVALTGSLTHLLSNEQIAEKKFQNFEAYLQVYPEYRFVFLGDSGQGDVILGHRMLTAHGDRVDAVFIHDVVNKKEAYGLELPHERLFYHDSYIGAAIEAEGLGLISRAGLIRVAKAAVAELAAIRFSTELLLGERRADFKRDLERLNAKLLPEERVEMP